MNLGHQRLNIILEGSFHRAPGPTESFVRSSLKARLIQALR